MLTEKELNEIKKEYPEYIPTRKSSTRALNLTGQQIFDWTVLYRGENNKSHQSQWVCQCKCGNIKLVLGTNLSQQKSHNCGLCKKTLKEKEKKEYKELFGENSKGRENLINQRFGKLLVISPAPNQEKRTYWNCLCDCGNTTIVLTAHLKNGHTKSCGCLHDLQSTKNIKKAQEKLKIDYETKYINKKFGNLTVLQRTHDTYWLMKCDCGNIKEINIANVLSGATVSCGCYNKKILYQRGEDLTNKKFGKLTVQYLLPERIKKERIWHCKCDCGNEIDVRVGALRSGNTSSCGCIKSKNNAKIHSMLQELSLNFISEWKIPNSLKRFDFYVNNCYIIEFDGEQHFNEKHNWDKETFYKQHESDLIKNKYCFDNNIPLIRITYDAKYTIDDLKLETTRFLLTPENEQIYYESRK